MIQVGKISQRGPLSYAVFSWLIIVLIAIATFILINGHYSKKEEVKGYVFGKDTIRVIAHQAGYVTDVLVDNGQQVEKNQPLVKINAMTSDTYTRDGVSTNTIAKNNIYEMLNKDKVEREHAKNIYEERILLLEKQKIEVSELVKLASKNVKHTEERIKTLRSRIDDYKKMSDMGAISKSKYIEYQHQYENSLQELNIAKKDEITQRERFLSISSSEKDLRNDLFNLESELERRKFELDDKLKMLLESEEYVVVAPSAGKVTSITAFKGNVSEVGSLIMQISGLNNNEIDDDMYVNLLIPSTSVGFVSAGSEIGVRVNAFPYESYGILKGTVISITQASLTSMTNNFSKLESNDEQNYLAKVKIDFTEKDKIDPDWLKDGMLVNASIKINDLSLIEWLFLPVVKGLNKNPEYFKNIENSNKRIQ